MALTFQKLALRGFVPEKARNTAFLLPNNWDDYGHKTLFDLTVFDEKGNKHEIGSIKIGFAGQNEGWTEEQIPNRFDVLEKHFFSLGQDADYYQDLIRCLSQDVVVNVLTALGDVAYDTNRLQLAENEGVFNDSLLRSVSRISIEHQYKRILNGEALISPE